MKKEKWIYDGKYVHFWFGWYFDLSFQICGYFDNRPRINIALGFFYLTLVFPFKNKWTNECDAPKWGIAIHNNTFWIYLGGKGNMNGGGKWWTFNLPWSWQWVRTSVLLRDKTWEHETRFQKKHFWEEKWKDVLWTFEAPYTYKLKSGEVQHRIATVGVEEREWRWNALKWSKFPRRISRTIKVDFDDEVGERSGSWKGGTLGCGYVLLPNETPLACLRRMENNRKFN